MYGYTVVIYPLFLSHSKKIDLLNTPCHTVLHIYVWANLLDRRVFTQYGLYYVFFIKKLWKYTVSLIVYRLFFLGAINTNRNPDKRRTKYDLKTGEGDRLVFTLIIADLFNLIK